MARPVPPGHRLLLVWTGISSCSGGATSPLPCIDLNPERQRRLVQMGPPGGRGWRSAACGRGPCAHPPCRCPCKKSRASLRRMKAELYSSWLGKGTSRWSCTGPHPSPLPEPKKTGRAIKGSRCLPLSFAQAEAGERRAGVAAVTGRPGLARALGLRRGGGQLGEGGWARGHFWSWELPLAQAGLRAPGLGRGCLGCAHRPT